MTDFVIGSDAGRIGQFWWFNSDTRVRRFALGTAPHIALEGLPVVKWGTFGFGRDLAINLTAFIE